MSDDNAKKIEQLRNVLKKYPDFPKKGIVFWDIFSILSSGPSCQLLQSILVDSLRTEFPSAQAVVGLESRGFLFAFSLAAELGVACVPVRKKGKLPGDVAAYKYQLEYGEDIVEIQKDAITPGLKCVIVDDLIATGGTLGASVSLLRSCGAQVLGALVVMELSALNGRKKIPKDIRVHSLLQLD